MKKITLSLAMLASVAIGYSQQEASNSRTAPKHTATAKPVRNARPATKDANAANATRNAETAPANNNAAAPTREAVNDPNAANNKRGAPKQ